MSSTLIALESSFRGKQGPLALSTLMSVWGMQGTGYAAGPLHGDPLARAHGAIANLAATVENVKANRGKHAVFFVAGYIDRTWADIGIASAIRYDALIASVVGDQVPTHTILLDGGSIFEGEFGSGTTNAEFAHTRHIQTTRMSLGEAVKRGSYTRVLMEDVSLAIRRALTLGPTGSAAEKQFLCSLLAPIGVETDALRYYGI